MSAIPDLRWCMLLVMLMSGISLQTSGGTADTAKPLKRAKTKDPGEAGGFRNVYPLAVLPFQVRGALAGEPGDQELRSKISSLLFANLAKRSELFLVERDDLDRLLAEQELSAAGLVSPSQANQLGQLTGAKILITGAALHVDGQRHLVAKIMGTETSRVIGASVEGSSDDELSVLVKRLADRIAKVLSTQADQLVAPPIPQVDRLAALKKRMNGGRRPSLVIHIPEQHMGQTARDPAAATELIRYCSELGFTVLESNDGKDQADIRLIGEGFTEFTARRGNLVSVKARLELKAVDQKTGQVMAADRQTAVRVDLAEQLAAKGALQEAAATIAERMLPAIANARTSKRGKPKSSQPAPRRRR